MADREQGFNNKAISGPGTTLLTDRQCILKQVIFPGTYVGTLAIYDSPTTAGTAAGNQIISFPIPATSIFQSVELNVNCTNGLVVTATGTPTSNVIWG